MDKKILFVVFLLSTVSSVATAAGPTKQGDSEPKVLSGISVVGNNEAPKSLYIVPWKSSEAGLETQMNSSLNENMAPVDKEVFMRQLKFYEISNAK